MASQLIANWIEAPNAGLSRFGNSLVTERRLHGWIDQFPVYAVLDDADHVGLTPRASFIQHPVRAHSTPRDWLTGSDDCGVLQCTRTPPRKHRILSWQPTNLIAFALNLG
jgi:hypothetical protein